MEQNQLIPDEVSQNVLNLETLVDQLKKQLALKQQEIELLQKQNQIKKFTAIGLLKDYDNLIKQFPLSTYVWGIAWNRNYPAEIQMNTWNKGIRISFVQDYFHGDDAAKLHKGNSIFTRDTIDQQSQGRFCHRYINSDGSYSEHTQNHLSIHGNEDHIQNIKIYARLI